MTTETTTLTAWLLEQIAADEAVARAAIGTESPTWWVDGPAKESRKWWICATGEKFEREETATHIATHDPARVLATCAAHRAIVESYEYAVRLSERFQDDDDTNKWEWIAREDALERAVRALLSIYKDAPGFDSRWTA